MMAEVDDAENMVTGEEVDKPKLDSMGRAYSTGKRKDACLLYTSPSPRDRSLSRMPSSA